MNTPPMELELNHGANQKPKDIEVEITMPDGSSHIGVFPGDWSDDQIKEAIHKQQPNVEKAFQAEKQNQESAAEPAPQEPKENETNWDKFKNYLSGQYDEPDDIKSAGENLLRYGVKDPLQGIYDMFHNARTGPEAEALSNLIQSHLPKGVGQGQNLPEFLNLPQEENKRDVMAKMVPDALLSLLAPELKLKNLYQIKGPKWLATGQRLARQEKFDKMLDNMPAWSKYLQRTAEMGIPQAAIAAGEANPGERGKAALAADAVTTPFAIASKMAESTSPMLRNVARLVSSSVGGGLGYEMGGGVGAALGGLLGGAFPRTTQRSVEQHMLENVGKLEHELPMEAARRLKIHLEPGEATGNPHQAGKEAVVGTTPEGSQLRYERGEERNLQVQKNHKALLDKIYNNNDDMIKENLYDQSRHIRVNPKDLEKISHTDVFKGAEERLLKNEALTDKMTRKGIKPGTVGYLDLIKQQMDIDIAKAERLENKTVAAERTEQKNNLLDLLDKEAPDTHPRARAIHERLVARRKIEKAFENKTVTANNFSKFLEKHEDYRKLQHALRTAPEAAQMLKDMKLAYKNVIPPPTAKEQAALTRRGLNEKRTNVIDAFKNYVLHKLHVGPHDLHAIELLTGGDWQRKLNSLYKPTNEQNLRSSLIQNAGKTSAAVNRKKD